MYVAALATKTATDIAWQPGVFYNLFKDRLSLKIKR